MQKYKMLKHQSGVHDGHLHPIEFHKGETYEIGDNLADQFIELGAVEMVSGGDDEAGEKSLDGSPANKAKKAAPENKAK